MIHSTVLCDGECYDTYGIGFGDRNYRDLTPEREKAEAFCRLLNESDVEDCHIEELIEDFLV